jgi:hypothetical protein
METAVPESVNALYTRMQDAMIPLVQRHVVSIAAYDSKAGLRQHATGTLVRFSDHFFLVTAAHAIEAYHKGKCPYPDLRLFIDNGDSEDLVPLYGSYQATQTVRDQERPRLRLQGERDDLWDIGLWNLDRRTVDALTKKRFLNRRSISITDDLTTGAYFLAGCPCSWARTDAPPWSIKWKWLRYITHPYPERDALPKDFDDRFHIALCLGEDPELPRQMEGISGCAIWKLADLPVKEDWTVDQARVVAVETGVFTKRPRKAIKGTKWQCVAKVLAKLHPEIRETFKLWLPGRE